MGPINSFFLVTMASRILLNSAQEIDATLYTGYIALVIRGTGLVRDTGIQPISGQKFFYDTITFYSGLNVTGDFVPSGDVAGNLTPKTNNLYDLGSISKEWRNAYFDGFIRTDTLHVDENANITGNLLVSGNISGSGTLNIVGNSQLGNTTITGDFSPNNFATSFIPKTDNLYDIGSLSNEVRNIFVDGTGQIDSLIVDENALIASGLSVSGSISGGSINTSGSVTVGTLFVTGSGIPTGTGAAGTAGQIVWGSGYLYVCTGTNAWGRTHLTGWT